MRWSALVVLWLAAAAVWAQEGALQADFRREGEHFSEACGKFGLKTVAGCAVELFTDHPLHIAAGSIAPQNGFGFGGAFVTHYTPNESWRLSWDLDAVGSMNGSWRAGGYMKIIHTPVVKIQVITPATGNTSKQPSTGPSITVHPYTVFNVYAQSISLNKLNFFGLGNDSTVAGKSLFGMQETIVGANAIKPVTEWAAIRRLNLALLGEVNGRFVNLRGNHDTSTPSIETLYDEATAPGLASQPAFAQLGQGVRIKPSLFGDHLQLNYLANFQEFFAPSNSHYSFLRWTVDLGHSIPLYSHTQSYAPKDANGPDECAPAPGAAKCPPVSYSANLSGAIGVRLLLSESINSASSVVPFYFQQTLGGGDINGSPSLGSFQDYRFRGPNLLLLRESFEHSIWGPFGFTFMADQGKVTVARGDIAFDHLKRSFATGLTLRAGGFPMVFLMFAWGGGEGTHTIANMNTSLLGGSSRPPLD
ncbi:MAG: hypothetical protein LAO24_06480 [Acidobacteriia bacterium]|nr:hypothetical protein [Terriglobia bacterium]